MDQKVNTLINKLEEAIILLKSAHNSDEKVALINYIGNLYDSIISCFGEVIEPNERKLYGSIKSRKNFYKKLTIYENQMLENFVLYKDFHQTYLEDILFSVEERLYSLDQREEKEGILLSKGDFYEILYDFFKSIKQEKLYDRFVSSNDIYEIDSDDFDNCLGYMIYNPLNQDSDVFIINFSYDLSSLFILVHELGHVYDLYNFNEGILEYNKYFYKSLYNEVVSKMFERLFVRFLFDKRILVEEAKEELYDLEWNNYEYLLSSYILSLIDDKFYKNKRYKKISTRMFIALLGEEFVDDNIEEFLDRTSRFDTLEDFSYAYGDILSLFLSEEVREKGFSNEMLEEFLKIRSSLFIPHYFDKYNLTTDKYINLYDKELQLLKK